MQNSRNKAQAGNAIGYSKTAVTFETKIGAFIFKKDNVCDKHFIRTRRVETQCFHQHVAT
jgi:hypothetical protein